LKIHPKYFFFFHYFCWSSHFDWPIAIFKKKYWALPKIEASRSFLLAHLYIYESSTLGKICGILCGVIWEHLGEHIENLGAHVENVIGKIMEEHRSGIWTGTRPRVLNQTRLMSPINPGRVRNKLGPTNPEPVRNQLGPTNPEPVRN